MVTVRYYCPRCETIVAMERGGYVADECVTPYPLSGWSYVGAGETSNQLTAFGSSVYLSFVRFEDGREVELEPESEYVT